MAIFTWRVYDTVVGAHFEVESPTRPTDRTGNAIDDNRTVILCDDRSCSPVNRIETTFKKDSTQPYMLVDQTVFTTVGEIIFPGTDVWTPSLVRAIMSCQLVATDLCTVMGGKPTKLTLKYTGEDCTATSHTQDPTKVSCSGDPAFAAPVRIVANDKTTFDDPTAKTWFDGTVNLNDTFMADSDGINADLKNNFYVHVLSISGDTVLQEIKFHTSCSQPLFMLDQFGSIVVLAGERNGVGTNSTNLYGLRLFDFTNGNVVAEILAGGTLFELVVAEEIVRTTTLLNLPAGEAIWEIQVLKEFVDTADGKIYHLTVEE